LSNAEGRSRFWGYWIVDPLVGAYNTILHYGMRLLPIDACSGLGAFLSFYSPFFFAESDARARRAWIRLRPEQSDPASVDAALRRLWRCVGRTMAEYSVLDRLWDAGRISFVGAENFDVAHAQGRPIIIAALHLGNWEALLVSGIKGGVDASGIYETVQNRFDMKIALRVRDRYNAAQVAAGRFGPGALLQGLKALEAKRPFVVHVDELTNGRVMAPSFGRRRQTQGNLVHVVRMAATANAAVIPAYCERVADSARFKLHVLPPIEMVRTGDRKADTAANLERVNAVLEDVVRRHLDQWYYLLDFESDD
jgi:KDO2-lipid IV(A) lauroyltransferase